MPFFSSVSCITPLLKPFHHPHTSDCLPLLADQPGDPARTASSASGESLYRGQTRCFDPVKGGRTSGLKGNWQDKVELKGRTNVDGISGPMAPEPRNPFNR